MNKPLILAVEDDTAVRNLITTTLETQDYRFHTAANGAQAILEAASQKPDLRPFWRHPPIIRILCFWIWGFRTWMEWK